MINNESMLLYLSDVYGFYLNKSSATNEAREYGSAKIGHFEVGNSGEGDLRLIRGARHFVVIEAKLHSRGISDLTS
jgi:hypothetical protein